MIVENGYFVNCITFTTLITMDKQKIEKAVDDGFFYSLGRWERVKK